MDTRANIILVDVFVWFFRYFDFDSVSLKFVKLNIFIFQFLNFFSMAYG